MHPSNFVFHRESHQSAQFTPLRLIRLLLALGLFLAIGQKGFGQTMTLSAPSSGATAVDTMAVVMSISGETGGISSARLVMTYTSGYSTASIGSVWTMTMLSKSATQSFSFNPSTVTSSALFSSVSPATNPPDGVYSVQVEYTRTLTGAIVLSNRATSVTVDTAALPPTFSYSPTVAIDTATDVITIPGTTAVTTHPTTDVVYLANHGLAANTAVTISGTNLTSSTTYYVSLVDSNSFKLATTSDGSTFGDFTGRTGSLSPACHLLPDGTPVTVSGTNLSSSTPFYVSAINSNSFKLTTTQGGATFADFTTSASPTITYPEMTSDVRSLGTTTASFHYKLPENYATGTAKLTFTGHTTVTLTLANSVRNGRISFDRTSISGPGILSTTSPTLPDDSYTVTLTYRDLNNHTSTAATLPYMFYDAGTLPPSFTSLVDGAAINDGSIISYTLPEAPYGGTVKLTFSNATTTTVLPLTNATSATFTYQRALYAASIPTGTYSVTLSYQDTAGNALASTSVSGVTVTSPPLSNTDDTDGDGINDAAELLLASTGLNWQVSQPALATTFLSSAGLYTKAQLDADRIAGHNDVTSNPGNYSLYTTSQLQNLYLGSPLIFKDAATGKWKLTMALQKSTDLINFSPFRFTSEGTSVNGSGQVEFLFTVPEDNAFFRLGTF